MIPQAALRGHSEQYTEVEQVRYYERLRMGQGVEFLHTANLGPRYTVVTLASEERGF